MIKRETNVYLVDALSFTEAEKRITEKVLPFVSGEFTVANIRRVKLAELFFDDAGDRWFRCKVNMLVLDESKDTEKRIAQAIMVQATTLKEAVDTLIDRLKNTLGDYEIAAVVETSILDVYPYEVPEEEDK